MNYFTSDRVCGLCGTKFEGRTSSKYCSEKCKKESIKIKSKIRKLNGPSKPKQVKQDNPSKCNGCFHFRELSSNKADKACLYILDARMARLQSVEKCTFYSKEKPLNLDKKRVRRFNLHME